MKVAIVGSRTLGCECLSCIEENLPVGCSEIISGGAVGIDKLAEEYAIKNNIKLTVITPDYDTFDRAAPIIRNAQIVKESDYVLILWDGKSKGSLNVIMNCIKTKKPFKLLIVKPEQPA